MLHIGLTGGIASGKSTVATIMSSLGAVIIDADVLARDVVAYDTPGLDAVVMAFGPGILQRDGSLDRRALAEIVFDDERALSRLNAIVHPLVRAASAARVRELPEDAIVVHDVPLLVENGMSAQYHLVAVVGASMAVRLARAVQRGLAESAAMARIATQADDQARRLAADVWIDNEDDPENLRFVVELLWRVRILSFAQNLVNGVAAEPGELAAHDVLDVHDGLRSQHGVRMVARIEHAAPGALRDLRALDSPRDAVVDLLELRGTAVRPIGALGLLPAGFVARRDGVFGNADPGRPATLRVDSDIGGAQVTSVGCQR